MSDVRYAVYITRPVMAPALKRLSKNEDWIGFQVCIMCVCRRGGGGG